MRTDTTERSDCATQCECLCDTCVIFGAGCYRPEHIGIEKKKAAECQGHPAGSDDPMGETVYCDGTCR